MGKEKFSEKVRGALGQLVRPAYFAGSVASMATTGMPLPGLPDGSQTDLDDLGGYHQMRAARDELKQSLTELAAEVRSETGQPLIFIIDELDRCRPTFAIELLERVKHIFDVPNIAFVFGINRRELVKSLESVYGDIDAGTYLRRFFDMEFVLPDANPYRFCLYLVKRHGLETYASDLSRRDGSNHRFSEFRAIADYLAALVANMGLSLRDMDYCVRLVALAMRALPSTFPLHPALLVLLVAVKISDPDLYRRFVEGNARGAELINYVNDRLPTDVDSAEHPPAQVEMLNQVEAAAYSADSATTVEVALELLRDGRDSDLQHYLSAETARLDPESATDRQRLESIARHVRQYADYARRSGVNLGDLAGRIDLYSGWMGRE